MARPPASPAAQPASSARPRRPRRRGVTLTVAAALAIVVGGTLSACGDDDADAPKPAAGLPKQVRIAYQAIPNGDLVVKHEKWLEAALPGVDVTWTKFESGGDVNTAIVAGSIDIGLAGSSPVTRGLSAPLNITYRVPWIHDVIGDAESLVVRKDLGVTDVAGLKGKKVGTPFASTAHYSLLAALEKAGLSESDLTIVDLEPPDILAAWKRKSIDAAYVWTPVLAELRKDGTTLTTSTEVAADGHPTYDLAVVTDAFATSYPDVVKTWLQQQDRAVKLIKEKPDEAAAAVGAELNLSAAEVKEQFAGLTFLTGTEQVAQYLGTPDKPGPFADSLLAAAEFLHSQKKIDAVPDLASLQKAIATDALRAAFGSSS